MASYRRYEEENASLYGSSSPEATERTRLTSSSNSSSSKGGEGGTVLAGRSGGSLGITLLRGSLGGTGGPVMGGGGAAPPMPCIDVGEQDLRRQTTVRLYISGSPEASI